MTAWLVATAAAAAVAALLLLPRRLIARAQDRLARETIRRAESPLRLLTRAEMVAGRYRRLPGVLAFREELLEFTGLHGDSRVVPMESVRKIATGRRLASGRTLFRQEALRLTRGGGEEIEFVVSPSSAGAWRSHLGLWAGRERERENNAKTEQVVPGRR